MVIALGARVSEDGEGAKGSLLALFGRRPVERAGLSLLPASKNQHNTGSRSSSVNDLVGAQKDCFDDGHSEAFRDLEVHDQLEPRRPISGQR